MKMALSDVSASGKAEISPEANHFKNSTMKESRYDF